MRKRITLTLASVMALSLAACGSPMPNKNPSSASAQSSPAIESSSAAEKSKSKTNENANDRPGAQWINSGIYGTYEGLDKIRLEDDFAAAVNRDWAENVTIGEDAVNASARTEQADNYNKEKIAVLTGEEKDDGDLMSLQNYYALLTDWEARNNEGFEPLQPYLEDLMSISSVEEMTQYYSDPERNLFGTPMVELSLTTEPLDPFANMLCIRTPILLTDEVDDYQQNGQETDKLAQKHQTANYMLKKIGYSEEEAEETFKKARDFEQNFLPGIEAVMADATGDPTETVTIEELKERYKNLPFADVLKSLGYNIDVKGKVLLGYMPIIDSFNENYTNENIEGIKAWTLVNTLLEFTKYCDRETYEETAKINGKKALKSDELYALEIMGATVPSMLDQMYVKYCFDKSIQPKVTELTNMMVNAYREMIKEEDWLSEETKAAAIEKLDNIKLHICYPENLPDVQCESILTAEEGETALSAIIKGRQYHKRWEANVLNQKNDGTYWQYENYYSTVGACYLPQDNSINIFAGICGGDYFNPEWPLEKNLGGLCMIVGHELTHAFDTEGADYDKDGAKKNWWTDEDRQAFQERVDKLKKYYSEIVPMPQVSDETYGEEGANRVQKEAIADLGALKCLLSIAEKQEDFDYDTFFKQVAIIQKEARYEEEEQKYVATNEHPVEAYRCNIPVQNYDKFIEFYNIKEGDGMYLAPEDRITVW